MMKRKRIEMARAGKMTGPIIGGRASIDQNHVGVAAMFREPSCVHQQVVILSHSHIASSERPRPRNFTFAPRCRPLR